MPLKRHASCAVTATVSLATLASSVLLFALLELRSAAAARRRLGHSHVDFTRVSSRAHVIDHGLPFSFSPPGFSELHESITVASAVSVDELRVIVFVVWDRLSSAALRKTGLPVSWACEFKRKNDQTVRTALQLRANGEAAGPRALTTSIWSCAWPRPGDWDRRAVRIVGPNLNVKGGGIFPLE